MQLFLICYDISDDGRRGRCSRLLLDYGHRVQKSVFECFLDDKLLLKLRKDIWPLIKPQEDSLRLYNLCKKCREGIDLVGMGPPPEDPYEGLILL